MAQIDFVYDYIVQNYAVNEPIFLSKIMIPDIKDVIVRQQIKKLTDDGRLKRFDTGIYYLPGKSIFASGSMPSIDDIITRKYLMDGEKKCGYIGGLMFANMLGITTQVPSVYEIYTNKATTDYRETNIANIKIILRKPYVEINDDNASILQFMDLLKEIVGIAEIEGKDLTARLFEYMKKKKISIDSMDKYLSFYPERIYKNMYEVKLLNGISAWK